MNSKMMISKKVSVIKCSYFHRNELTLF